MKSIVSKYRFVHLCLFYFIYSNSTLFSQTLTANNCLPVPGDTLVFQMANYLSPGPAGSAQVWDFSKLMNDGVPLEYIYSLPNNLPSDTSNPVSGANLSCRRDLPSPPYPPGFYQIQYLKADSSGLFDLGDGARMYNYYNHPNIKPYPARIVLLKLPFQLNDTSFSRADYQTSYTRYFWSTYMLADGTGTLITPCGTYSNTLRIHRNRYSRSLSKQASSSSFAYHDTEDRYEWYSPGVHEAILSICSTTSSMAWTTTKYYTYSYIYDDKSKSPLIYTPPPPPPPPTPTPTPAPSTSSSSPAEVSSYDFYFQNPSDQILFLSLQKPNVFVDIIDLAGKYIYSKMAFYSTLQLDISTIAPGLYIIQTTTTSGEIKRKKLVIERR